jgi:phage tail sheath gpL-like
MGINSEVDVVANLQIGPTDQGMVRIYVAGEGVDLPLDFDPDEADEIAEELRLAAIKARSMAPAPKGPRPPPKAPKPAR